MAEFERIAELEAAMRPTAQGQIPAITMIAVMAALGHQGRTILVGGRCDEDDFALALWNDHFVAFTSMEEIRKSGLDGCFMEIPEFLRFAARDRDQVDGILLNPENQAVPLSQAQIHEILNLISDEEEPLDDGENEDEYLPGTLWRYTPEDEGWDWLPEKVAVYAQPGTVLSQQARDIFLHFRYYSNCGKSFAMFGDHVGAFFQTVPDEELDPDACMEQLTEEAEDIMSESVSYHPDFGKYTMDDGMLAVRLFSGVWCFHSPGDYAAPTDYSGEPTMSVALDLRQELLEACDRGRILLIAMPLEE